MKTFFRELQRRKVYVVGAAYAVVGWLVLQVAATVLPIYNAPEWALQAFTTLLFLGFPVALVLAWAYDITPDGVQRTDPVGEDRPPAHDPALDMPEGPTISVLPFRNLSADPEQDLFAQAMTEDIVKGLTQNSKLAVVAPGPVPSGVSAIEAGRQLGVQHVLLGSVNKSGDQLRVTARLSHTPSAREIWSGSYDETLSARSLFEVQDDIRQQIVSTLGDFHGVIYSSATREGANRPTENLNAYECLAVALAYDKQLTERAHLKARESLERAIELDPEFDDAWSHLSWIYTDEVVFGFNPKPHSMERALSAAHRAIELNPTNYHSHWLLSRVHYFNGERDQFLAEAEKSLELNASDGTTLGLLGGYMALAGEWERGARLLAKARKLNPRHPDYYHVFQALIDLHAGDAERARTESLKANLGGWPIGLMLQAGLSALVGNLDEARKFRGRLSDLIGAVDTDRLLAQWRTFLPFQPELAKRLVDALGQLP